MSANKTADRVSLIKARFERNFREALKKDTEKSLGDRSKYIGASDISGCLRSSYLSKVAKKEDDISQLLTFERGHQFESIVRKFLNGETFKEQVEIKNAKTSNGFPLKPHLDFVIYDKNKKRATIVEVKSTKNTIELYESYVLQIQLQMGLLQAQCGSNWTVNGLVFVISTESEYEIFPVEQNKILFDMAMQKADILADSLKKGIEPKAEVQLYCNKCPFKGNCEAISKGVDKQLPVNVKINIRKLKQLQNVEKEIKGLKNTVKSFMEATNTFVAKCDDTTVSLFQNTGDKYSIDVNLLRVEEPDIYAKYRRESKGSSWLRII
ncbi:PD-(D/E)XK nuclease family protein [Aliarcobacter lanthieri]|uniref:PD-(D/E)XK nuclease family protein n=1 Tax=Aliarcobacter lanthieri TaxID=1355374 RepID=UPI003AAFF31D